MDEDDEETLLLAPTVKAKRVMNSIKQAGRGVLWNRILMLAILAGFACFALYSETQISDLNQQLQEAESKLSQLDDRTQKHDVVIQRFNTSVTNQDVLKQLKALQTELEESEKNLNESLEKAKAEIHKELDDTVDQLSKSVTEAENEIASKVEDVKKNVEQYVISTQDQFSMENDFMVYQLAGTFTLLSCLISMWHMSAHVRKLNQPDVQRKILAILWMSPIYAVTSWFSLVFPNVEGYLAIIKDGYEAYVIYMFLSFCISVIGKGDRNRVVDILAHHADHLTPPFRLCVCFEVCGCVKPRPYESNRHLADAILLQCQLFAMQFVFFRPVTTTSMVVLKKLNYFGGGDGPMDYRAPQLYLTIIQNLSIFIAFTGLLKFYHAVDKELAWCRPFAKFLCIKGVVFMTFWQGLAISLLAEATDVASGDAEEWAKKAQNFLICLEMLLFSIAHFYCFPTEEWEEGYRVKHSKGKFGDSIALGDFFNDLKLILKSNHRHKKKKKDALSIPEGDEESESEATSAASIVSEEDQKRQICEALHESLGEDADDPDILEATQRLLESNVLSPEFFDADSDLNESDGFNEEDARKQLFGDSGTPEGLSEVEEDVDDEEESDDDDIEPAKENTCFPNDATNPPDERTSLLSSPDFGSSFAEALRPSIFTTVASIAEIEKNSSHAKTEKSVEE